MTEPPPAFDENEFANRVARNESRFREINEVIESGRDRDDDVHRVGFVCECGLPDCARIVEMTPAEYEEARSSARRFVVVDGHQLPELERVVDVNERYTIVEKIRGVEIVEDRDPRSP